MNAKEAAEVFRQLGWTPKQDVDRFAVKKLDDRVVQIIFRVKDFGIYQTFDGRFSVKCDQFTGAVREIKGDTKEYNDVLRADFDNKFQIEEREITPQHIAAVCDRATNWALSVDITARYGELAQLDPSTPGAAGVWHLAALAILGDVEKLKSYQASFAAGDKRGFVPYITNDYIDRAVLAAERGV